MTIQVPILGEAVRALITKDSVKVLDRYNKRYLLTNFSYLQKFSSVPLSLDKLQDALIGNPTFKLKDATIDTSDNMMMAIFQDAKVKNTIFALFNNLRVKKNIYIDKIQNVDITAIYPEFEEIEGQQIHCNLPDVLAITIMWRSSTKDTGPVTFTRSPVNSISPHP